MFARVLIANRGEIARRVIRTCDRLGIGSVAVFTQVDRGAPHVREAGQATPISSYLEIDAILDACARSGADAVHPGYGFLSENPELARACIAAGIAFVGPPSDAAALMADKLQAKAAAQRAGLPIVPTFSEAQAAADGAVASYPLLVKAAAGGGGRGMRVVNAPGELAAALASARREAQAGFGDDRVFIERFLPRARHIEVQIIADAHGTVLHLGERECSLQRRHQKVIEEAPSPVVTPALRDQLGGEAIALARASGYEGAGTVEFIAAAEDPAEHYFLEMNARLQVEHPVTEMVTGLDLVELQLRVAADEQLTLTQEQVTLTGHAIEARITAEDAAQGFLPTTGRVLAYHRPRGARVDDAIETGSEIDTSYDSLLAKVIVHGPDRARALGELDRALAGTAILGLTTTTAFLRDLIAVPAVRDGALDTALIERETIPAGGPEPETIALAAALVNLAGEHADGSDPFARTDGWRLSGRRTGSWWRLAIAGGSPLEFAAQPPAAYAPVVAEPGALLLTIGGERREWRYARDGEVTWVATGGGAWAVRASAADEAQDAHADGDLRAPMPGSVLLVPASAGQTVCAGDPLVVLESMKMELVMTAPVDGVVTEVSVAVGDRVVVDRLLARVEASG
ncbi:MAG: acetyl/propionyl-CoA carboxylase subunit alpha [Actinomycetota bacterium]|nr:acetyl/propionyl-CoA carboxylase subunit alpha [Actinomycetota bacterium]